MTRVSQAQRAFSSGEIDPRLHQRSDYQRFQTGLARCRGFLPMVQGGVTRAPGTFWRGRTRNDAAPLLVPFIFAEDDAAVLEFTPFAMRVWRYGAPVMAGAVPYEIATPFGAAALRRLQWVQSADVLYLADGQRPIQRLARFALDHWEIAPLALDLGPFRVQNLDRDRTLQVSGATGAVTLTASAALFEADHVGSLMRMEPTDFTSVPLWTGNTAVSPGDLVRYDRQIYELTVGSNTGVNPPVHREGRALTQEGIEWRHVSDDTGIVRITAVASPTEATATVIRTIPKPCIDDPTYRWAEGAWSDRYGWPAAIEIFEQRLIAAATASEPRTVWFSAIGNFADFNPSVEADGSFAYTIDGAETQNRIATLRRGRSGLHVFAMGEEYSTRSDGRNAPLTPTTAVFRMDSSHGAAPARPVAPDGNPIVIARDRRRVLMIAYSLEQESNRALDLTLPAAHLGDSPFEQIVWQSSPMRIGWLRRQGGDLAAMVHDPAEEVLGWALHSLAGGECVAMCVTPSANGRRDVVTLAVRRVLDGQVICAIEDMAQIHIARAGTVGPAEANHLFAAADIAAAEPTDSLPVPHLANATCYAWTDRGCVGPVSVGADGTATLPVPVTRAIIGLHDPTHEIETLDLQGASPEGSTLPRLKRVQSGWAIGVLRTSQGGVQAIERNLGQPDRLVPHSPRQIVPAEVAAPPRPAVTGVARIDLPTGHAQQLSLRVVPVPCAPLTVTAIAPIVQEAGR